MIEGRDWVSVVAAGPCPDCGLDASMGRRAAIGTEVEIVAGRWTALLTSSGTDALRVRPVPTTWSALEYAAHVRDVLAVMSERTVRMTREDDPELGWWDHDAAAVDERYNDQDRADVAAALAARAADFATVLASVDDGDWDRTGIRGDGSRFTVDGMARFVLHETHHHLRDAERSLDPT